MFNRILPTCNCTPGKQIPRNCVMKTPLTDYVVPVQRFKDVVSWKPSARTCLHIRRGDVTQAWKNRFVPVHSYARHVEEGSDVVIHTEHESNWKSWLVSNWTDVHYNAPVLRVVKDCVSAHHFIGSCTSALSILIALLRESSRVTLLCRHRALLPHPPGHWQLINI